MKVLVWVMLTHFGMLHFNQPAEKQTALRGSVHAGFKLLQFVL